MTAASALPRDIGQAERGLGSLLEPLLAEAACLFPSGLPWCSSTARNRPPLTSLSTGRLQAGSLHGSRRRRRWAACARRA